MPVVDIAYNNAEVDTADVKALAEAIHVVVVKAAGIEDVPVYATKADVIVEAAPVEIFIRISKQKIIDREALVNAIRKGISAWKKRAAFTHKVNFTLIPMDWDISIEE